MKGRRCIGAPSLHSAKPHATLLHRGSSLGAACSALPAEWGHSHLPAVSHVWVWALFVHNELPQHPVLVQPPGEDGLLCLHQQLLLLQTKGVIFVTEIETCACPLLLPTEGEKSAAGTGESRCRSPMEGDQCAPIPRIETEERRDEEPGLQARLMSPIKGSPE